VLRVEDPLMLEIRCPDTLVDELARGEGEAQDPAT
jgi:hypothetical protein